MDEHRKYIEKDAALERRFQPVLVEEPSEVGGDQSLPDTSSTTVVGTNHCLPRHPSRLRPLPFPARARRRALRGGATQLDPGLEALDPTLASRDFQLLKLKHDGPLSNVALNCNLRPSSWGP